jgi:hypothetical protein
MIPFYVTCSSNNQKYDLLDLNHILSKEFNWDLDSFDLVEIRFKDNKTRYALNPPTDLHDEDVERISFRIEKLLN